MKKILTLIVDGLGVREEETGNAIIAANMPNYKCLLEKYPHSKLEASGPAIGLSENQVSNPKVSYETIAAGQILKQQSSYAAEFTQKDSLATSASIKEAIEHVKKYKSTIHIVGLMSDGGINSNIKDTLKLIDYLKEQGVNIVVDFISDGVDVEVKSATEYLKMLEEKEVTIATVCGRYYAMDTENKVDRTKFFYELIKGGNGLKIKDIHLALKNCYMRNITDEFLPPMILVPDKNIKDNDVIFWMNYLEEGNEKILTALTNSDEFEDFPTKKLINTKMYMLFPISSRINGTVLINDQSDMSNSLGIYLNKLGISEARIASQQNFEYITYYFNGETNEKLSKCNNYNITIKEEETQEPNKYVINQISKQISKCMEKDTDFIIASIPNLIDAAKTGDFDYTVKLLEYFDECLGTIIESAELNFYTIFLLSSGGNVEEMIRENGKSRTINTSNKVPFIITDQKLKLVDGDLTNVAPTILKYMDISIPESMKESNILIKE